MKRLLIVRASSIGDVIQTLPVFSQLKAHYPGAAIDWVVEHKIAPLLEAVGVDRVIPIQSKRWYSRHCIAQSLALLRAEKYDLLFDFQGNIKSGLITTFAKAKVKVGFGWKSVREKPNVLATSLRFNPSVLNAREKYLALIRAYWDHCGDRQKSTPMPLNMTLASADQSILEELLGHPLMQNSCTLMIAIGSRWKNKMIQEKMLIELLAQNSALKEASFMVVFSNPEEERIAHEIALAFPKQTLVRGNLSLPLWFAWMQRVKGVIAVDSAALHLAGAAQVPSFSFFGPTRAEVFKPSEPIHAVHQSSCPYGTSFPKHCPLLRTCATGACLRDLSMPQVQEAFNQWIFNFLLKKGLL